MKYVYKDLVVYALCVAEQIEATNHSSHKQAISGPKASQCFTVITEMNPFISIWSGNRWNCQN